MVASLARLVSFFALVCGLIAAPMGILALPTASAVEDARPAPVVDGLRVNGLTDPLGISGDAPRLNWTMDAPRRGVIQEAYQIRVTTTNGEEVWDSGKVSSRQSVEVAYDGPALTSHTPYTWTVRVWDDSGSISAWSDPASSQYSST